MNLQKLAITKLRFILILFIILIISNSQSIAAPQGGFSAYLPSVLTPAVDLRISNMIISQGIQTSANSVPLVKDRPTLVRIFAESVDGTSVNNVSVNLVASRNGTNLGSISIGPRTVPTSPTEAVYNSTYNVVLPASWLDGTVSFTATVDPANSINEQNEGNNSLNVTLPFTSVPPLSVTVVPIDYTHQGGANPGFYGGNRVDYISDWLMDVYPVGQVDVKIRSANLAFVGNLDQGDDWSTLLNNVTDLKLMDLGSEHLPEIYYGFIPTGNGNVNWFSSGIAGLGWLGVRASIGLNLGNTNTTGSLAGHEIGHNLDRYHAPCNVSGDPNYPYAGASIGHFGLDNIDSGSPTLLNPNNYVDMMSYCDPNWVSDYTYEGLLQDQLVNGRIAEKAPTLVNSLLIRGQILEDGSVMIKPVYTLPQLPSPAAVESDYFVELLNEAGEVVFTSPVAVTEAHEPGVEVLSILTAIPLPEASFASIRIVHVETAVGSRTMSNQIANLAVEATTSQSAETAAIRWGIEDIPAVVRYTADGGDSWVTVGVDVLGGELMVDTTTLPGGDEGRFEIVLADSGETAVLSTSLPSPLPNRAPLVWITGADEAKQGHFTVLQGHGSDAEDGVLHTMTWLVNGETVSQQTSLSLDTLTAGKYLIELIVEDSHGEVETAHKWVTIVP